MSTNKLEDDIFQFLDKKNGNNERDIDMEIKELDDLVVMKSNTKTRLEEVVKNLETEKIKFRHFMVNKIFQEHITDLLKDLKRIYYKVEDHLTMENLVQGAVEATRFLGDNLIKIGSGFSHTEITKMSEDEFIKNIERLGISAEYLNKEMEKIINKMENKNE